MSTRQVLVLCLISNYMKYKLYTIQPSIVEFFIYYSGSTVIERISIKAPAQRKPVLKSFLSENVWNIFKEGKFLSLCPPPQMAFLLVLSVANILHCVSWPSASQAVHSHYGAKLSLFSLRQLYPCSSLSHCMLNIYVYLCIYLYIDIGLACPDGAV